MAIDYQYSVENFSAVLESIRNQNMVFKSTASMMYLFIAIILQLLNVSFVMSQGLSRYDKKGKILLMTYFIDQVTNCSKLKLDKSMNLHRNIICINVLQILM